MKVDVLREKIGCFKELLPYKTGDFAKRSWGHKLHSLCSYQGKMKPSIANWLVNNFVEKNGVVLDPLGGVGTIPYEAALLGRHAISNDKSPLAALIAKAKLDPPALSSALETVDVFEAEIARIALSDDDYRSAEFGLNAKVAEYFHSRTLEEVLQARRLFISHGNWSQSQSFFWATLLHILHGNRPYALSRNSHPITPFSPTGPAVYKNIFMHVREAMHRSLSAPMPQTFRPGMGIEGDYKDLPSKISVKADAIITSPPFWGMRFDRPNWLRLWFCGWSEEDFHNKSLEFLERQQVKDSACYREFFFTCRSLISENGVLVIHMGSGKSTNLLEDIMLYASKFFDKQGELSENVESVEQHGIVDKGLTTKHHFIFYLPK